MTFWAKAENEKDNNNIINRYLKVFMILMFNVRVYDDNNHTLRPGAKCEKSENRGIKLQA